MGNILNIWLVVSILTFSFGAQVQAAVPGNSTVAAQPASKPASKPSASSDAQMYFAPRVKERLDKLHAQAASLDSFALLAEVQGLRSWLPDDAFVDESYAKLLKAPHVHPLLRDQLRYLLSLRARHQGDEAQAARLLNATGRLSRFMLLDSFDNVGGQGFLQAAIDEDLLQIDAQDLEPEDFINAPHWHQVQGAASQAFVDLAPYLDSSDARMVYVLFDLHSKRGQKVALRWGASAQVCVKVGSETPRCFDEKHGWAFEQHALGLQLQAGSNPVLMRLGNIDGRFRLGLRLTRPDGSPLKNPPELRSQFALGTVQLSQYKTRFIDALDLVSEMQKQLDKTASKIPDKPLSKVAARRRRLALLNMAQVRSYAKIYDARNEPNAIAKALREALDIDDTDAETWFLYASALQIFDRNAQRRALEKCLQLQTSHLRALTAMGRLRLRQERYSDAQGYMNQAQKIAPLSPPVVLARIDSLVGADGDEDDVARALHEALQNCHARWGPKACAPLQNRWRSLLMLWQRYPEEEALAAQSLWQDPMNWGALWSQMRAAKRAGDLDKYLKQLTKMTELQPQSVLAKLRVLSFLLHNGQAQKARQNLRALVTHYPRRSDLWALRGEAALLAGDKAQARKCWKLALRLRPQQPTLQRRLEHIETQDQEADALLLDPDLQALRKLPTPDTAKPFGVYVLSRQLSVQVFANGLYRSVEDEVIRLLDKNHADMLRRRYTGYAPGREEVKVLVAERIKADGTAVPPRKIRDFGPSGRSHGVYTDQRSKVIQFDQLEPGDTIHIKTRTDAVGETNLFGDFFGRIDLAQTGLPLARFDMVVEAPTDHPLYYFTRGVQAHKMANPDDSKLMRYVFSARDLPGHRFESNMPPLFDLLPYVSISSYQDWDSMANWFAKLIAQQYALDDETRKVAQSLVQGLDPNDKSQKTQRERVRRIYNYVIKKTRYVGIELGIHGWKPYRASLVHRRGYGDCKDKATLLVAMLGEVGVEARLVLLRTRRLGRLQSKPATMWAFNHAIAYVPDLHQFLDGTAEFSGMNELPAGDQGAMALLVSRTGQATLKSPPESVAADNVNHSNYVVQLTANGDYQIRGEEHFSGAYNARQRRRYSDKARQKELLEQRLAKSLPGVQLQDLQFSDLDDVDKNVVYHFTAHVPGRAKTTEQGLELPVSLYPQELTRAYAANQERLYDVVTSYPWRGENNMRYVFPAGYALKDLPQDVEIKTPYLHFSQHFERQADGFVLHELSELVQRRIPLKDYAAFRQACLKADAAMQRRVLLRKEKGGKS